VLRDSGWAEPVSASRRSMAGEVASVRLDTMDLDALTLALKDCDAVVNCVAGDGASIAQGAAVLAQACLRAGTPRIVHLSSMAVYGAAEGDVHESQPLDPALGWYARAKCVAEGHVASFARAGGVAINLRPGCVSGPGSELWVGRIGRWLRTRRLGDLGEAGDGWSNLVHVDDVCQAVLAALRLRQPAAEVASYNLAAPDSPRWNEYFVDLALAIGATPVHRIIGQQIKADAFVGGPALKLVQIACRRVKRSAAWLPDPMPPNLLGLWERHLRLDSTAAQRDLKLHWTGYDDTLQESAQWFLQQQPEARAA
jgi:nucleoside-diphosphate-sugar epimerase